MNEPWAQLAGRIEAQLGLDVAGLGPERLGRRLASLAQRGSAVGPHELLARSWDEAAALLVPALTVGETYFFRDPAALARLAELAARRQDAAPGTRVRIWSAACCTGEEPYSLAMVLLERNPALAARCEILATDLNPEFLARAAAAEYRSWSLRATSAPRRARFFQPLADGSWQLTPAVRAAVRFAPLNLAADSYPGGAGGLDAIVCQNVLMYFSARQAAAARVRLAASLAPGGLLCVTPGETEADSFPGLRQLAPGVFTKAAAPDRRAAAQAPRRRVAGAVPPPLSVPAAAAAGAAPGPRPAPAAGTAARPSAAAPGGGRGTPADALCRQAAAALEQGDAVRAQRCATGALVLEPGHLMATYVLAAGHLRAGHRARGRALLAALSASLSACAPGGPVPAGDGLTAGQLAGLLQQHLETT